MRRNCNAGAHASFGVVLQQVSLQGLHKALSLVVIHAKYLPAVSREGGALHNPLNPKP